MKYHCNLCDYKTENKNAWYNHKNTDKHKKLESLNKSLSDKLNSDTNLNDSDKINLEIVLLKEKLNSLENEKKMICEQLRDIQKQYETRLIETKSQLDKTIDQYENRLAESKEQFQNQLIESKDHIETLRMENNFQKQLINSAGGIIQRSMNTMSYLLLNYNDAPGLTQLSDYSIMSKNVDSLINDLIFYYKKNKLDKHIGDFIVQQYKKKEPELQSIWSSDVDRLNYFIRELINDSGNNSDNIIILKTKKTQTKCDKNKFQWVIDKKGIKMTEYIIDPLLNYISTIGTAYLQQKNKQINEGFDIHKDAKLLEDIQIVASINCDIKNNTLSKNINKYIAPHFYLEKNK